VWTRINTLNLLVDKAITGYHDFGPFQYCGSTAHAMNPSPRLGAVHCKQFIRRHLFHLNV
jgi:hypothetical protein